MHREGLSARAEKEFRQAIEDYDRAIELEPDLPQLHYYRGCAWAELEDLDRAIADSRSDPKRSTPFPGLSCRGFTYLKKKEYDKAIADLDESIRLEPKNSGAWVDRGLRLVQKGESEKGLTNMVEALRLEPSNTQAARYRVYGLKWRVRHLLNNSDFDGALVELKALLPFAADDYQFYCYRAEARIGKSDFSSAISDYSKAVELNPKCQDAQLQLARARWNLPAQLSRDPDKALSHTLKACELSQWRDPMALECLAHAYSAAGRNGLAIVWQKKGDRAYP